MIEFEMFGRSNLGNIFAMSLGWLSFCSAVSFNMGLNGTAGPDVVSLCVSVGVTFMNYALGLITGYSTWKASKVAGCVLSALGCYIFTL